MYLRGLLISESLTRLPFIIHTDWKDETDSGSSSFGLRRVPVCEGELELRLYFCCARGKKKDVEVKKWPELC